MLGLHLSLLRRLLVGWLVSQIWFSILVWFKYIVGLNKIVTSIFSVWECELMVKDRDNEPQFPSSILGAVLTHCIILLKSFKFRWNGPHWSWWDNTCFSFSSLVDSSIQFCPSAINLNLLICCCTGSL